MPLEGADDVAEQRRVRQIVVDACEAEPELQPVPRRRCELLGDRQHLLLDACGRPHGVVPEEVDAGARDLRPRIDPVRRRAAERRRIREPERKDGLPGDQQVAGRCVDQGLRHRRYHHAT
jgi:hypothetical protein